MNFSPTLATDAELVAWMVDGREGCVLELVTRYGHALGVLLRRLTGNSPDWEDLAQETWIRVVRHAGRYNPDYAFATWLFRIAWNLAMDLRKARRHDQLPEGDEVHADPDPHPEAVAMAEAQRERLWEGMRALPAGLGELLALRYFEELTERELAERLEIPTGTVKSRLHKAHRQLAVLLGVTP